MVDASKLSQSFAAVFSMETRQAQGGYTRSNAVVRSCWQLHSFSWALNSTHTIPRIQAPVHGPPWHSSSYSSTHHMAIRHCLYRRTDGRRTDGSPGREPAETALGWGSHGDSCRSRWRPCVNNPRRLALSLTRRARGRGIGFRGRRTANQRRVKRGGSTCTSRRVARRRSTGGTWPPSPLRCRCRRGN